LGSANVGNTFVFTIALQKKNIIGWFCLKRILKQHFFALFLHC
jgi:hypothetical protein